MRLLIIDLLRRCFGSCGVAVLFGFGRCSVFFRFGRFSVCPCVRCGLCFLQLHIDVVLVHALRMKAHTTKPISSARMSSAMRMEPFVVSTTAARPSVALMA